MTLEVFGPPGTVATINYLDVDAQPQRVDDTTLPWSYNVTTTDPAVFVNVMAQGPMSINQLAYLYDECALRIAGVYNVAQPNDR